jgi:hypothetical protein
MYRDADKNRVLNDKPLEMHGAKDFNLKGVTIGVVEEY